MQTIKPKTRWHGDPGSLGITHQQYFGLTRFVSKAEAFGVKATAIGRETFGRCLLKMSSGTNDYELLVSDSGMLLGQLTGGKRVRLCEGGTNTEAQWARLLLTLRNSEGRLSA